MRATVAAQVLALFGAMSVRAEIAFPPAELHDPIVVSADQASHWREGTIDVVLLQGRCVVQQGNTVATGAAAVLRIDQPPVESLQPCRVLAYIEGDVRVDYAGARVQYNAGGRGPGPSIQPAWRGRFESIQPVQWQVPVFDTQPPHVKPAIFERAIAERPPPRQPAIDPVQFVSPLPPVTDTPLPATAPGGTRKIEIYPRSSARVQGKFFPSPVNDEWIAVIDSGVNVIVQGVGALGKIDVVTDRMVMWTRGIEQLNLSGASLQDANLPLEIYMEGNIVFRQADRVIYAERMYYNIKGEYGVVLDAEMLTPIPQYQGLVRLKADILQQFNRQQFKAYGGSFTSSRLGVPRYWLQSRGVDFEDVQQPLVNPFTGEAALDPVTGDVAVDHALLATSRNNLLYLGGLPVFWWPVMATDLTEPSFYIDSLRISNDRVFGTQIGADLNMYQLLGWRTAPQGTKWTMPLDYFSDRGPGIGSYFQWRRENLLGIPGPYWGMLDVWGVHDAGFDTLGAGRSLLVFPNEYRGRVRGQHRHLMPGGFQLTAEIGWASDRNFLEQYFDRDWDQLKDQSTGVELKQFLGNQTWSVSADYNLTNTVTQTDNLPRFDHFLLGQSLLGDRLTWYGHSQIGFHQLNTAMLSPYPDDPSNYLPWERATGQPLTDTYGRREGLRAITRQEIDLPLQLGAVKVVPYALGEVGYWHQDRDGQEVTRAYGQTGVRASLPIWKVNPTVQSTLLNLNGMAHKAVFDAEFFYADSSQDVTRFPLYEPTNDDSIEAFQRRFLLAPLGTFPGFPEIPAIYDDRYFALRGDTQGNVTSSVSEIADDLLVLRGGIRQRWQTKRGQPGQQRIIDWIVFDVNASYFPDPQRDPFGDDANLESFLGNVDYDFRWHVGDRVSLMSDGYFDTFGGGLRTMSVSGTINRPDRGRLFLGYRWYDGPFEGNVISAGVNYRMSEKWSAVYAASIDMGETGNVAQGFRVTRIGESLLVSLGFTYSLARDNVGVQFLIEPRFMPPSRLRRIAGVSVGPAGLYGLE